MNCCAEGCGSAARYKSAKLCQRHYFRLRRTGTTDDRVIKPCKARVITPNGYVTVPAKGHILANKNGRAFEHRMVVYGDVGCAAMHCALCGKPESWATCHIDHINNVRTDNSPSNLRVTCRACNCTRDKKPSTEWARSVVVYAFGESKTLSDWARDERAFVAGGTIKRRMASGMSAEDAITSEKITHKNKPATKPKAIRTPTATGIGQVSATATG